MNYNKVKKKLVEEKEKILSKQTEISDIDISGDEVDEIQGKILANVQAQLTSRDKVKLKSIEIALLKISEGTFGKCDDCGDSISEKRLEINPVFTKCITCAEQLELDARQTKR